MKTLLWVLLLTQWLVSRVGLGITCYETVAVWAKGISATYFYRPEWLDPESASRPNLYIQSNVISSLDDWAKVGRLKRVMLEGSFAFTSLEGRIGGHFHERQRVFYVGEGHHRLAAALEIAYETGNWTYFNKLIRYGDWEKTKVVPRMHFALPVRSTLWTTLTWRRFLKPFSPG